MKEFKIDMDVQSNKYIVVEVGKESTIENSVAEGNSRSEAMRCGLSNLKQWRQMTNSQEDFIIFFDYDNIKKDVEENGESRRV
jgi:hypothetical protein